LTPNTRSPRGVSSRFVALRSLVIGPATRILDAHPGPTQATAKPDTGQGRSRTATREARPCTRGTTFATDGGTRARGKAPRDRAAPQSQREGRKIE